MATKTQIPAALSETDFIALFSESRERDAWEYIANSRTITLDAYSRTARIHWPSATEANGGPPEGGARSAIKDMSARSRMDAAHSLGSAECNWLATSLLTFPFTPAGPAVKETLEKFTRAYRARWEEPLCAWVMEMTRAGRPHFHLFHAAESAFGLSLAAAADERGFEIVRRPGHDGKFHEVELFRGPAECWLVETWLECLGGLGEYETRCRAFHRGGIIEKLRSPDAAGRYIAKEAGKRYQKKLPGWYASGLGRWWNIARKHRPRLRGTITVNRADWPFPFPFRYVWDSEVICAMEQISDNETKPQTTNL